MTDDKEENNNTNTPKINQRKIIITYKQILSKSENYPPRLKLP